MKIVNYIDGCGHQEFRFKEDNVIFKICYRDNFDLYWSIFKLGERTDLIYQEFIITKEYPFIYNLFAKLYNNIVSFPDNNKDLFNGEKITWISDDRNYNKDSLVQISQKDDMFILEFAKKDKEDSYYPKEFGHGITIRFSNSGSYYTPYNIFFMKMYNELNDYLIEFGEMPKAKNQTISQKKK